MTSRMNYVLSSKKEIVKVLDTGYEYTGMYLIDE